MMNSLAFFAFYFITCQTAVALIASNSTTVTGNVTFVCAFFREKNLSIDDAQMPEILTFCSCVVVDRFWALTSRQCFVQVEWYVTVVTDPFKDLPAKLHTIKQILDMDELTMVQVDPGFDVAPINISTNHLRMQKQCEMYGFTTPDRLPVKGDKCNALYKVWHMEGDVIEVKMQALPFETCAMKYPGGLSEYKPRITNSTLCLDSLVTEDVEPCSFDRGAPILCDGKLQGILVYERPLPKDLPLYLPTGCYGNINKSMSLYAEGITSFYSSWIKSSIKFHGEMFVSSFK